MLAVLDLMRKTTVCWPLMSIFKGFFSRSNFDNGFLLTCCLCDLSGTALCTAVPWMLNLVCFPGPFCQELQFLLSPWGPRASTAHLPSSLFWVLRPF